MSQPSTGGGFQADPQSLRSDAEIWSGAAHTLSGAAGVATGLVVDPLAFSYLANQTTGIDQTYAALQAKLAKLLAEGTQSFADIAAALRTTAATYDQAEQAALDAIGRPAAQLGDAAAVAGSSAAEGATDGE